MITNGIYVTLPGLRLLKANVMNPITFGRVDTKVIMVVIYIIQILIIVIFVLGMVILNKRVT